MNFSDSPPLNRLGTHHRRRRSSRPSSLSRRSFLPAADVASCRSAFAGRVGNSPLRLDLRPPRQLLRRPRTAGSCSPASAVLALALIAARTGQSRSATSSCAISTSPSSSVGTPISRPPRLTGIYQIQMSLEPAASPAASANPAYLAEVGRVSPEWLPSSSRKSVHVSHAERRLSSTQHEHARRRSPPTTRLPADSRELAAQYLLLYEMSLPYGLDLNNHDQRPTRAPPGSS